MVLSTSDANFPFCVGATAVLACQDLVDGPPHVGEGVRCSDWGATNPRPTAHCAPRCSAAFLLDSEETAPVY